jgi:hypothetical protein
MQMELNKRITRNYVGTYQHLDEWELVGTINEIGSKEIPQSEDDKADLCEPHAHTVYAVVTSDKPDSVVSAALHDTYTQAGCAHDYDCCGCRSFYASGAKRVTGDLWQVTVSSFRNY